MDAGPVMVTKGKEEEEEEEEEEEQQQQEFFAFNQQSVMLQRDEQHLPGAPAATAF